MSDDEVTNLLVRALSPIERDRHDGACRTLQLLHGRPARFVGPFSLAGIVVDARDGGSVAAVYTDAVCRRAAVPRSMAALAPTSGPKRPSDSSSGCIGSCWL